jgi:hypothetical protein
LNEEKGKEETDHGRGFFGFAKFEVIGVPCCFDVAKAVNVEEGGKARIVPLPAGFFVSTLLFWQKSNDGCLIWAARPE